MSRIAFVKRALHGKVLDVGHAVGPLHQEIAKEWNVTAIDIVLRSPEHQAVKGDATIMPFKSGTFDSILAGEVLEHLEEPSLLLREGKRVLKKGGTLVLTTPNRQSLLNRLVHAYEKPAHLSLFSQEELLSLFQEAGYRVERFACFPYTQESSEGSRYGWFYPIRRAMHPFLPKALQEQMAIVARAV